VKTEHILKDPSIWFRNDKRL